MFALFTTLSLAAALQQPDSAALRILRESAAALGGEARVRGATGFVLQLEGATIASGAGQAADPAARTSKTLVERRFVVDLVNRRLRREGRTVYPGPITFNNLTLADTTGARTVDLMQWRTGTAIGRDAKQASLNSMAIFERLLAHTAVRQAMLGDSLRYGGVEVQDNRRVHSVTYRDPAGQRVTLRIDAASQLPATMTPGEQGATVEWLQYADREGLQVAQQWVARAGAGFAEFLRIMEVQLSPALADSLFVLPPGYSDAPPPGKPAATRIAEGVYRADGMPSGYHTAFVVQPSGVVVFDAPLSPQWTAAVVQLIEQAAPGQPITHVLASHHHGDHVAGLATYVQRGARVVTGPGVPDVLRRALPDSIRARAQFDIVRDKLTIGSGTTRVDAYLLPNDHANASVIYHVPARGVLMHGDLFYIPEQGPVPPAFTVTLDLQSAIARLGLAVEQIVGVHGRTGSAQQLSESIRKRASMVPGGPRH